MALEQTRRGTLLQGLTSIRFSRRLLDVELATLIDYPEYTKGTLRSLTRFSVVALMLLNMTQMDRVPSFGL